LLGYLRNILLTAVATIVHHPSLYIRLQPQFRSLHPGHHPIEQAVRLFTASIFRLELVFLSCMPIASTPIALARPLPSRERPDDAGLQTLVSAPLPGTTSSPHEHHHGDVVAARGHAPAAHPRRSLGLPSRPAALEAAVLSPQPGTQELQLLGPQHEEERGRLLHSATHARVVAHRQPGRGHVEQPACRSEVRYCCPHPLHREANCGTNILCSSPQLATPRRSLFTSNLFQQLDTRGKWWLCIRTGGIRTGLTSIKQQQPPR
jgi:hypothetical protein